MMFEMTSEFKIQIIILEKTSGFNIQIVNSLMNVKGFTWYNCITRPLWNHGYRSCDHAIQPDLHVIRNCSQ